MCKRDQTHDIHILSSSTRHNSFTCEWFVCMWFIHIRLYQMRLICARVMTLRPTNDIRLIHIHMRLIHMRLGCVRVMTLRPANDIHAWFWVLPCHVEDKCWPVVSVCLCLCLCMCLCLCLCLCLCARLRVYSRVGARECVCVMDTYIYAYI